MPNRESVLITGGAGFIGSNTADALIQRGSSVVMLDNLSTGKQENVNREARLYHVDLNDEDWVSKVFRYDNITEVLHEASQISVKASTENPVNDANVNIIGTLKLLQECARRKVKKFVFASSGAVYGNPDELPATEKTALQPISPYGVAKLAVENYLRFYSAKYSIRCVSLRYANVYGQRQNPKSEAGAIAVFIDKLIRGEQASIWGTGEQARDFVHVEDVAAANIKALEYDGSQSVFNIGTGKLTAINHIYEAVRKAVGTDRKPARQEYDEPVQCISLDSKLAGQELLWMPKIGLEEGIGKTVEWYRRTR